MGSGSRHRRAEGGSGCPFGCGGSNGSVIAQVSGGKDKPYKTVRKPACAVQFSPSVCENRTHPSSVCSIARVFECVCVFGGFRPPENRKIGNE